MPSQPEDRPSPTTPRERRKQTRNEDPRWRTAITRIEPNKILIRGYPVDEMMGRLSFAEAIYLILRGELPSPVHRQAVRRGAGVVHRPRGDATLDARGA